MKIKEKNQIRQRRRQRIRKKIQGIESKPRLSLCITNKHMHAQCVDDTKGSTLYYLSTVAKQFRSNIKNPNMETAKVFGTVFGEGAKNAGIEKVVFDRNGRRFHGAVKAFVDAVRKSIVC